MIVALEHSEVNSSVHSESVCNGTPCPVHHKTDHHMRGMVQSLRPDTGVIERICEHGVGHPDPDSWSYLETWQLVHGCDGCCHPGITKG